MWFFRQASISVLIHVPVFFFCFSLQNAFAIYYKVEHRLGKTVYLKVENARNGVIASINVDRLNRFSSYRFTEIQANEARNQLHPLLQITGGVEQPLRSGNDVHTENTLIGLDHAFTALETPGFDQTLTHEEIRLNNNERRLLVFIETQEPEKVSEIMAEAAKLANGLMSVGLISRWHPQLSPINRYNQRRITLSITGQASDDRNSSLRTAPGSGNYYPSSIALNNALHQFVHRFGDQRISFAEPTQDNTHTNERTIYAPASQRFQVVVAPTHFSSAVYERLEQRRLLHTPSSQLSLREPGLAQENFIMNILISNSDTGLDNLEGRLGWIMTYLANHHQYYDFRAVQIRHLVELEQTQVTFELIHYIPERRNADGRNEAGPGLSPFQLARSTSGVVMPRVWHPLQIRNLNHRLQSGTESFIGNSEWPGQNLYQRHVREPVNGEGGANDRGQMSFNQTGASVQNEGDEFGQNDLLPLNSSLNSLLMLMKSTDL